MLIHGRVVNGKIEMEELEEGNTLPDGIEVIVIVREDNFELSPEDEAELEDRIAARMD